MVVTDFVVAASDDVIDVVVVDISGDVVGVIVACCRHGGHRH